MRARRNARTLSARTIAACSLLVAMVAMVVTGVRINPALAQADPPTPGEGDVSNDSSVARPIPITPDGVSNPIPSLEDHRFTFTGTAHTWVRFTSTRTMAVDAPYEGRDFILSDDTAVRLPTSGTYIISVPAVTSNAGSITLTSVPDVPVRSLALGTTTFDVIPGQPQWGRLAVKGGVRYKIKLKSSETSTRFCLLSQALDNSFKSYAHPSVNGAPGIFQQVPTSVPVGPAPPAADKPAANPWDSNTAKCASVADESFIPLYDQTVLVVAYSPEQDRVEGSITELPSDRVVDPTPEGLAQAQSTPYARTMMPLWGPVSQRAVVASPDPAYVANYGEPWIEREGPSRTYLVPSQFRANVAPYIAWGGGSTAQTATLYRFQGDDDVFPLTLGITVKTENRPWLRSVVPFTLVQGHRYQIVLRGSNLSDAGFAVRETNGRRVTSAASWNYDEATAVDGSVTTASTILDARHGGQWALEIDPRSAIVAGVDVTVNDIGGRTPYEPSTKVKDPVFPGEAVDVDLLPGEWAEVPFETGGRAVTVEPVALRYRNTTFDLTAADVTIWDPDGRLVYSNNKDLQEEVFSGRLGKESNGAERFVLLRPNTKYRVILDPLGELAGRFRLSMRSNNATEIVPVDLTKGTRISPEQVGILEVRGAPVSLKVDGPACIKTSTLGVNDLCLNNQAVTLHPGVHMVIAQGAAITVAAAPLGSGRVAEEVSYTPGSAPIRIDRPSLVRVAVSQADKLYRTAGNAPIQAVLDPDGVPIEGKGFQFTPERTGTYTFVMLGGPSSDPMFGLRDPIDPYVTEPLQPGASVTRTFIDGQGVLFTFTVPRKSYYNYTTVAFRANDTGLFDAGGVSHQGVLVPGVRYELLVRGNGEERFKLELIDATPRRSPTRKPAATKKKAASKSRTR